jgi:hypothetical protein
MLEIKTLSIKKLRDSYGNPTCATNLEKCDFYISENGIEICHFKREAIDRRGENQKGTIIPCSHCPLWSNDELG